MSSKNKWITPLLRQSWVASSALLLMMANGMHIAMTSSLVPALQAPDSPITLTPKDSSWIVSSIGYGSALVLFLTPFIITRYGRRKGLIIILIPGFIAPFLAVFVLDVRVLILSRFMIGGAGGGSGLLAAIIIGEYTAPEYRGIFLSLKSASTYVGFTLVHIVGHFFNWKVVFFIANVPFILTIIITLNSPESPSWLITQMDYDGCTEAFYWVRGKSEATMQELREMLVAQKKKSYEKKTITESMLDFVMKLKKKNFLKPVGIYIVVAFLLEFSGRHTYSAYAMQIVREMDSDPSHTFYYTLCFDLLMTASAFLSALLIKMMNRRTLLFSSGVSSVTIVLGLSAYYYLQSINIVSKDWNLISLILFASYFLLVNLGCTPICLNLLGELFPLEHRATGTSISVIMISLVFVGTVEVVSLMMVTVKLYGLFGVFGAVMVVSMVILYFTLPETKDKTLQEIENYFDYGTYKVVEMKSEVEKLRMEEKDSKAFV